MAKKINKKTFDRKIREVHKVVEAYITAAERMNDALGDITDYYYNSDKTGLTQEEREKMEHLLHTADDRVGNVLDMGGIE